MSCHRGTFFFEFCFAPLAVPVVHTYAIAGELLGVPSQGLCMWVVVRPAGVLR